MVLNVELPMCLLNWIDKDKLDWNWISSNVNAIELLKKNPEKINCYQLSRNFNAIKLLNKNPDNIYWGRLEENFVL